MPGQQPFYPQSAAGAKQAAPFRKASGTSPASKGIRQPPMSAGQARSSNYMPQTRVSGAFQRQAY